MRSRAGVTRGIGSSWRIVVPGFRRLSTGVVAGTVRSLSVGCTAVGVWRARVVVLCAQAAPPLTAMNEASRGAIRFFTVVSLARKGPHQGLRDNDRSLDT